MELWIRSQDRETLKQAYHLDIYSLLDSEIDNYWYIEESGTDLGVYNSKERALEILNEIQYCIICIGETFDFARELKQKISAKVSVNIKTNVVIYEMPEE